MTDTTYEIADAAPDGVSPETGPPESGPPAWPGVVAAVGAALVLYALIPALAFAGRWGLVNYDDPYLTAPANPAIGKGLLGGLPDLLVPPDGKPFMDAWLPLYYWSLGLDHALFGDRWLGWHLHSAVLHALCAGLVVLVARRLGMRAAAATTAGVIFALHPVATESVAWVASRKDQLSFAWAAAAALVYLRGVRASRPALHVLGAACLFVALTAKGTALVLPLLLVVHALLLRSGGTRAARLRPLIPYGVVAAAMALVHVAFARSTGAAGSGTGAGLGDLVVANLEVVWLYARSLFLPWFGWLSVEHGVDPFAPTTLRVALGGVVLVIWGVATATAWRKSRPLAAVLVAVPLALAPFNNVFPRTSVLFAERYAYVALLPFALGAAAWLTARIGRFAPVAAALVLGLLAAPRLGAWSDSVSLWENAAGTASGSSFVRMQLADAYAERARSEPDAASRWNASAESAWRAARAGAAALVGRAEGAELATIRNVQATTGLGTFLLVTAGGAPDPRARVEEAVELFAAAETAIARVPSAAGHGERLYLILSNRAAARQALGQIEPAVDDWRAAAQLRPDDPTALLGLARAELAAGRGEDALKTLARSRDVAPENAQAARERAELLLAVGQVGAAKQELATALELRPDDVELLLAAGQLDLVLMRPVDAALRYERALALRPDNADARTGLASALVQQAQAYASRDDVEGARAAARRAGEVAPGSSAPEQILGIVARRLGALDDAADHLRRAYELQRDGPRIREALASVLVERANQLFAESREGAAFALLEEAVSVDAERLATASARLEEGVSGWPPLPVDATGTDLVTRQAGLRGLALLATGDAVKAKSELAVAEAGSRGGSAALRRVVVQLQARALLLLGDGTAATAVAAELPALAASLETYERGAAFEDVAAVWMERGIQERASATPDAADASFAEARRLLASGETAGLALSRVLLRRGEILFAEERFLEATRAFDEAITANPGDPDGYLDRAAVWRSHFLMEEDPAFLRGAEEDLRKALTIAPSDARISAALGEVLLLSRKPSEAFPWLQRAVLADPSQVGARALLADLLVRAGRSNLEKHAESRAESDLDEASSAATRALALDAPSPGAHLLDSDVQRARGRWGDSLRILEAAAERWPDHPDVRDALATYFRDLGHGYLVQRQDDAAVEAFRRALAVEGSSVDLEGVRDRLIGVAKAAFEQGVEARAAGKNAEAEPFFRRSIRAYETPEGWFQLAMAVSESEDLVPLAEAADAYEHALTLRPEYQAARLNRAGVLMRLGRPGEAAAEYRAWLEMAPDDDPDRRAVVHQIEVADGLEKELSEKLGRDGERPR